MVPLKELIPSDLTDNHTGSVVVNTTRMAATLDPKPS
jgi:hypothetical protein